MTLTQNQTEVLLAYLACGIEANGASTVDEMLGDNMTWGDVPTIAKMTGLTQKQVKPVIASLSEKGLLVITDEGVNGEGPVQQVLSDAGVRLAFDLRAAKSAIVEPSPENALVTAVREHAGANYTKDGWDFLVETWSDDDIVRTIGGAKTAKAAIAACRKALKTLDDHRAEVRAEADVPKQKKQKPAKADKPSTPKAPRVVQLQDRVITKPKALADVKALTEGSKRHLLAQALLRGATVEHLMEVVGWNRDTTTSALRYDMGMVGLGVERKGDKYFLIMPEGLKALPVKSRDMSRADALVAACK